MRICIEGLMGSGKSTFCEYLGTYIREPALGGFGNGFIGELNYLLARKRSWREHSSKAGLHYFDRSVWSSEVFWLPEYSYNHLSYDELQLLFTTRDALLRDADLPDLVVWLRASVLTCSRRLSVRGDFDSDTDIEYLCRLESSYVDLMDRLKSMGVQIMEISMDEDLYGEAREELYLQTVKEIYTRFDKSLLKSI